MPPNNQLRQNSRQPQLGDDSANLTAQIEYAPKSDAMLDKLYPAGEHDKPVDEDMEEYVDTSSV